ncbi:hypothetical protein ACLOJK_041504 [Asimina triloba]
MVAQNRSSKNQQEKPSHNPRKRNSKKSSTAAIVETQKENDIAGKASTLAAIVDNDGKGEYQEEVQTLDYDVGISIEVPANNQDMSTVDTSSARCKNDSQTGIEDKRVNAEDAPVTKPVRTLPQR